MSIWASINLVDCWNDACTGCEDCDWLGAPYLYAGSHVLPETTSPRFGSVHGAVLSEFVRAHRDGIPDDQVPIDALEPWLRFGIHGTDGSSALRVQDATVILHRPQVAAIVERLTDWLERTTP